MSKLRQFFCLTTLLLFPLIGLGQEEEMVRLDTLIEQLSEQCPHTCFSDGWSISKVMVSDNDTVFVEVRTPASLIGFISLLAVDNEKGRRLWVNHLLQYGDNWRLLIERLIQEGRPLKLAIRPRSSKESYFLSCDPDELGTILADN